MKRQKFNHRDTEHTEKKAERNDKIVVKAVNVGTDILTISPTIEREVAAMATMAKGENSPLSPLAD